MIPIQKSKRRMATAVVIRELPGRGEAGKGESLLRNPQANKKPDQVKR